MPNINTTANGVKFTSRDCDNERATGNIRDAAAALVRILVKRMQPRKTNTSAIYGLVPPIVVIPWAMTSDRPVAVTAAAMPTAEPDPFNAPGTRRDVKEETLPAGEPVRGPGDPALDARIGELEAAIARDEETVKRLISAPGLDGEEPPLGSDELREVASRLPLMQAELRTLRARRAPVPPPAR